MKTRDLAIRPEDCSATRNYIYADHSRLSFRTTLVAKERIHGRRGAIRDSYNAPIAKNVPANAVLADTSHRDAMAVATTIANQLQMARRDPVAFDVSDARLACREPSKSKAGRFAYAQECLHSSGLLSFLTKIVLVVVLVLVLEV
jgi:hypothetical protein